MCNVLLVHCSGGAGKADDAAELYVKAGNSFKMAKKWSGTYAKLFCMRYALVYSLLL